MTWSLNDLPDLSGRTAVVTGANAGLGLATTRALADAGARVVMACRDTAKAERARTDLGSVADPVSIERLDLADLASVRAFVDRLGGSPIDLLVNNAGLMAIDFARTADGFEMQFGVNHLGHMALTLGLLPNLVAVPDSRVVTVTSMGHRPGRIRLADPNFTTGGYGRWRAYFQSKLANLLFARELGRQLAAAGHGTLSVAAHPGYARTELGKDARNLTARGIALADRFAAQSAEAGALPTLRAATDPAAANGQLYGPRWQTFGAPVPAGSSRAGADPDLAAKLWALSLDLLGTRQPGALGGTPQHAN